MSDVTEQTWFTIAEACEYVRFSKPTLYAHMKSGRLPYYRAGDTNQRRFKREDLDALMVRGKPEEVEEASDVS